MGELTSAGKNPPPGLKVGDRVQDIVTKQIGIVEFSDKFKTLVYWGTHDSREHRDLVDTSYLRRLDTDGPARKSAVEGRTEGGSDHLRNDGV
jgi:hypothetical protein